MFSFTDMGIDPNLLTDEREPDFVFLEGCVAENDWLRNTDGCPICGGWVGGNRYCLRCDRAGTDKRCSYPGLPVGYAMDPNYPEDEAPATPTRYDPDRPGQIELPGRQVLTPSSTKAAKGAAAG